MSVVGDLSVESAVHREIHILAIKALLRNRIEVARYVPGDAGKSKLFAQGNEGFHFVVLPGDE